MADTLEDQSSFEKATLIAFATHALLATFFALCATCSVSEAQDRAARSAPLLQSHSSTILGTTRSYFLKTSFLSGSMEREKEATDHKRAARRPPDDSDLPRGHWQGTVKSGAGPPRPRSTEANRHAPQTPEIKSHRKTRGHFRCETLLFLRCC